MTARVLIGPLLICLSLSARAADQEVDFLPKNPLTVEEAVRIATLNNEDIKAVHSDMDAAQAERAREWIPVNPSLQAGVRYGEGERRADYSVTGDLSSLLFYPLKWSIAGTGYRREKSRAAAATRAIGAEVKGSYYRMVSLQETRALLAAGLEGAGIEAELAARQKQAGNINALDLSAHEMLKQDATLELAKVDLEVATEKQSLMRLLGMGSQSENLKVKDSLPPLPMRDPTSEEIMRVALDQSGDLALAQSELEAASKSLWWSRLNRLPLRAGVALEQEGSKSFIGPVAEVEMPLDLGWNVSSQARAKRDAASHRLSSARERIMADVRTAVTRMESARKTVDYYRSEVIPLRARILEETQKHYNFMLQGVYQLLHAKQDEYAARRGLIEAQRDYWIARADLEKILGGPLPETRPNGDKP